MRLSGMDYLRLIKQLPQPSPEQTARFADFVATAHSWYKKVPAFPPGALFTFFLDPNAGRTQILHPDGSSTFEDRIDPRERFHYSWMLTSDYREQFGFWQYAHAPWASAEGRAKSRCRPSIMGPGGWIEVAPAIVDAGTCTVTALMHDLLHARFDFWVTEFDELAASQPNDPEVRIYAQLRQLATQLRDDRLSPEAIEQVQRSIKDFHEHEKVRLRMSMREAMARAIAALNDSFSGE